MAWRHPGDKPLSESVILYQSTYASLSLNELYIQPEVPSRPNDPNSVIFVVFHNWSSNLQVRPVEFHDIDNDVKYVRFFYIFSKIIVIDEHIISSTVKNDVYKTVKLYVWLSLGGTARWLQLQPSSAWQRRRKRSKMLSLCTTHITARSSWDSLGF